MDLTDLIVFKSPCVLKIVFTRSSGYRISEPRSSLI